MASDNRWYPPEQHPANRSPVRSGPAHARTGDAPAVQEPTGPPRHARPAAGPTPPTAAAPTAAVPVPAPPPGPGTAVGDATGAAAPLPLVEFPAAPAPHVAQVRNPGAAWAGEGEYTRRQLTAAPSYRREVLDDLPARRDLRGAVYAVAALLVVVSTLLAWYRVSSVAHPDLLRRATVYSPLYRGWYLLVPLVAGAGVVVGVANWLLRPGDTGAVAVFILLRLLGVASVAVTVAAVVVHQPTAGHHLGHGPYSVGLLWPALAAAGAAVVGLLVSLAAGSTFRG